MKSQGEARQGNQLAKTNSGNRKKGCGCGSSGKQKQGVKRRKLSQ